MQKIQNKLDNYLSGIEAAPAQRTPEWYAIRKNTIGGSEIATVIGTNPYNSVEGLLAGKVGISSFNGNTACRWGTMFEHLTEKFTQIILKMDRPITEAGSVPGVFERQRYSPDGLGVVQLMNCDNELEYYVILFEFKAPLGTLPNGKIPKHYMAQVQTGMISIPLTEYTIFVNNCYRKCALQDLAFNGVYDKIYHGGDYKKRKHGLGQETPYACGIICFYQTQEEFDKIVKYYGYESDDEEYDIGKAFDDYEIDYTQGTDHNRYSDHDMELLLDSKGSLIDFGAASKFLVDRILDLYDDKRVKVVYYPIMINHERVNEMDFISTHELQSDKDNVADPIEYAERCITRFDKKCKQKGLCGIGYMPWKLMRSDVILENKDPEWYDTIKGPVTKTLEILNELNNSANPVDAYYRKYPMLEETEEYMEDMTSMADFMNPATSLSDMEDEDSN